MDLTAAIFYITIFHVPPACAGDMGEETMIDINVPNVITIGLIALATIALARFAKNAGVPYVPV